MRVTIEHREKSAGVVGQKKHFFVDCTVEFSEEEKAIIAARKLGEQYIYTSSEVPAGSGIEDFTYANTGLRVLSRLVALGGFVALIAGIFRVVPEWLFFLMWIVAFGIFVYRKLAERVAEKALVERNITIRDLLKRPRFTVAADTPAAGQEIEENLRDQLAAMKSEIMASAELRQKQTFEL
jgi:hypothetical protein